MGWTEETEGGTKFYRDLDGNKHYAEMIFEGWESLDGYADSKCTESYCTFYPSVDRCIEQGFSSVGGAVAGVHAISALCVSYVALWLL